MVKPRRLHGLKRPKIRQSWNKYNLYNISEARAPGLGNGAKDTYFQQKWKAKGLLRAYHGEHVVERKWARMFSRRLLGVSSTSPEYLAQNDGSEMARGKGFGLATRPRDVPQNKNGAETPYMQMTFAPMERRLDIAVFRAMFASSARQAAQFCIHGGVKVNGKVMPFPSYQLNPGDMFQVDPERVMFATGLPKHGTKPRRPRDQHRRGGKAAKATGEEEAATEEAKAEEEANEEETSGSAAEQDPDTTDLPEAEKQDMAPTKQEIQGLIKQAKEVLSEQKLTVAQKRRVRDFIKQSKPLLGKSSRASANPAEILEQLSEMVAGLKVEDSSAAEAADSATDQQQQQQKKQQLSVDDLSPEEKNRLRDLIAQEQENPHDPSKPYLTPWKPRPYMAPFAYIPQYLEVNQNICSAVYLRHPVARKGLAEVPTPYDQQTNQLAFNWYLQRK
ncbi:uncharacterized protein B0I36DRAFT_318275 [Microdochium trichocladiopsis]|uniref:RNA-binding S4 domain-containing protein n=1 Tax=Microdochium trichocladiopsis TaxID=1682393 RepID=A0A9P8YE75_9PEZI|nr:uncharacterized protein B0I36DRAFT_318275 [Microdochium trichocladiopsis]KAH7035403.1 hypothetical protein B0I36DRAFT_318275 [Microdochium trichocladiopsis]